MDFSDFYTESLSQLNDKIKYTINVKNSEEYQLMWEKKHENKLKKQKQRKKERERKIFLSKKRPWQLAPRPQ